jgi:hypothetical protein
MALAAACGKPQVVLYEPSDPALSRKLDVSPQQWAEMRIQLASHLTRQEPNDLRVIRWGRSSLTGDIEVWCAHAASGSPHRAGPVFFFRRVEDRFVLVTEEMSEWQEP